MPTPFLAPPSLIHMTQIRVEVGALVVLGPAPAGERRYVTLGAGSVNGPELTGRVVEGGIDWQTARSDGAIDIAAHYVIRTEDGALIEVRSEGLRHAPPDVMARLAAGEAVPAGEYFFRTLMRFNTGAPAWLHLNKVMAIAVGQRQAREVILDVYRIT